MYKRNSKGQFIKGSNLKGHFQKCLICDKKFWVYPSKTRKYCSRKCEVLSRYKRIIRKCLNCNKEFEIPLSKFKLGKGKYCCRKCYYEGYKHSKATKEKIGKSQFGKRGKEARGWKGGKFQDKKGYWWIYSPNHPRKTMRNYVKRATLIAEKRLGRFLTKTEVIHHINGNSSDDRLKNLYLFSSSSKHNKYHGNQYSENKPELKSNII